MKTIYFVRHGLSEANVARIMAGSEYETPLTDVGKEQAKKAGQALKDKGIQLVVASPMGRTMETAELICEQIGYDKSKIIKNELLVERGLGHYDGSPYEKYQSDVEENKVIMEGLESFEDFYLRVKKAFAWLESQDVDTILVVSHGATGRMFRVVDRKLAHDDFHEIERFDNCEIDEFTL